MKKLVPKPESVIAFMRFKGWEVIDKSKGFYTLKPPTDITPKSIRYKIPYSVKDYTYPLLATERVKEIADLYNWNQNSLINFLSKSTKEIDEILQLSMALVASKVKVS